jgi:hypothetical protein
LDEIKNEQGKEQVGRGNREHKRRRNSLSFFSAFFLDEIYSMSSPVHFHLEAMLPSLNAMQQAGIIN